jgi:hypothetical protein
MSFVTDLIDSAAKQLGHARDQLRNMTHRALAPIPLITQPNPAPSYNEKLDKPHFDSFLDVSTVNASNNAELTITLRILFEKVTTKHARVKMKDGKPHYPDANNELVEIRDWNRNEFSQYVTKAVHQANHYWNGRDNNGKLWLKTPDGFDRLDWPFYPNKPTHRPNIWCRFVCESVPDAIRAHVKVRVVAVAKQKGIFFRSNMQNWDSRDTDTSTTQSSGGGSSVKNTAAHEVGHLFGQHHIGEVQELPGCTSGPAVAGMCYGGSGDASLNIMGSGTKVTPDNASAWQKRLVQHFLLPGTKPEDWVAYSTRQFPKKL